MTSSIKTECQYLNGWIEKKKKKKNQTGYMRKILTQNGEPQRKKLGNAEEEEKEEDEEEECESIPVTARTAVRLLPGGVGVRRPLREREMWGSSPAFLGGVIPIT